MLVTYDFTKDKPRTKFAKFLKKYGRRIQYSVFEIKNSKRVQDNIIAEIKNKYEKMFTEDDSIVLIPICEQCRKKIVRFGYAASEESDIMIL